ncbi:tetratricopeptide repeat protein [Flavobacterium sp. JP2137]|uniref:tetratricopeptide repeat protein n=1 Tax=Flavobacterium sp. JP2137 TaxID=3414510 RepID=UPI003D2FCB5E
MRKNIITIFAALGLGCLAVSCVDNPYVTEDNYLNKPNAGRSWIVGLQKQLATTTNTVVINTEITSDNYYNNYSQYTKVFDIPQIDYFDSDVNGLQASIQTLREMADYGLNTILPKDNTLEQTDRAFMHFCKGYALLLGGELFVGLPAAKLGKVDSAKEMLAKAVVSFTQAMELETKEETKRIYSLLAARANYYLGDKELAAQFALQAIADTKLLYSVKFDGKNSLPNEMQNATFDALPNRLAPLPRLDYLDPKFFSVGTPSTDQKALALVKAEEAFLILAEVALASGKPQESKAYLKQLLDVVALRPVVLVDDKRETRNGGKRKDYPLKAVGVKFAADKPSVFGYVLDRQKEKVPVYTVSGTKVTKEQLEEATATDDLLYLIYLMRQEIFFCEGRRLSDLGIKYPISQIEAGNNPLVSAAYTQAIIPAFIPLQSGMDDFTADPATGEITVKYDMNELLVKNKNSQYIMPLFK